MGRKSDAVYKHMARTLRQGFIDTETTDDFPHLFKPGTSKAAIVRDLRRKGYAVGHELILSETKKGITVTDVHRTGNIASGFDASAGYDLRDIDDWTPQQKSKLTRVFNEVRKLSARPYQVYRPRKRENLEVVQKATQTTKVSPEINVAFVPVAHPEERAKIIITKRKQVFKKRGKEKEEVVPFVTVRERGTDKMPVLWSDIGITRKQLQRDPSGSAKKLVAEMKKHGASMFTPMAGLYEFSRSFTEDALLEEVDRIASDYKPERWLAFLLGIQAFNLPRRTDINKYTKARGKAKRAQIAANKKAASTFRKQQTAAKKKRQQKRKKRR